MTLHARHRIESSLAEGLQADFTLDVVSNISAPALSLAHAYDATGNRTAETVAGATTVYAYPPDSHRLTNLGGTARTFDAAGNLRVLNQGNRSSPEYAYDDRNRLSAYRVGGQDVATYAHNARGERVHKSAPKAGSATLFVYAEGGQLLGEYDGDGNVLQEYAWLDALPVAVLKKGGPYPIEPDHLGTPRRAIAPELDRPLWSWDLQGPAFGTHPANDDPDANGQPFPLNLRFPGQYLDAESGLHYNYFRDYDPATGRYVESDPVGLRGGVTSYSYGAGDPIASFDSKGLKPGDKFKTVADVLNDIRKYAPTLVPKFIEYGGWIYPINKCFTYNVTTSNLPSKIKYDDMMAIKPKDPVATWHTHGFRNSGVPGQGVNLLSEGDEDFAEDTGVPNYLIAPDGSVPGYDPDDGSATDPVLPGEPCSCE